MVLIFLFLIFFSNPLVNFQLFSISPLDKKINLLFFYLVFILLMVSFFNYSMSLIFLFNLTPQSKIINPLICFFFFKFDHHFFNCYFHLLDPFM